MASWPAYLRHHNPREAPFKPTELPGASAEVTPAQTDANAGLRSKNGVAGRRPTLRDVAQRAGVSNMTVSRVLNRERGVGPAKRAQVEQAMRELNYVPNAAAQALATAQLSDRVALLFDTQDMAILGEMVSAGAEEAVGLNVKLMFLRVARGSDPADTLQALQNLAVQAVLLSPPLCDDIPLRMALHEANLRFVAIGSSDAIPGVSNIGIDEGRAAYTLTCQLIRQGHRRISFAADDLRGRTAARRKAGYERALAEQGIAPDKYLRWRAASLCHSSAAAAEALALNPLVTAIVASNDDLAAIVDLSARDGAAACPPAASSENPVCAGVQWTIFPRPIRLMVAWSIRQIADELAALDRGEAPVIRSRRIDPEMAFADPDAEPVSL